MNKKKSAKHNKNLIFILLFFTSIAAYLNFILFPMLNKKEQLQTDLDSAYSLKQTMSYSILHDTDKTTKYEELVKNFDAKKSNLKYMTNEQIDTMINNLCQQCSLKQTDFAVSSKNYMDITNEDKIIVTQIRLQLTGESSGVFLFVDAIDKIKNLFIDSFTIADLANSKNYSTVLNLYTLNK